MKQVLFIFSLGGLATWASAAERVEIPATLKLYIGGSIWGPTYNVELRDNNALHYSTRESGRETAEVIIPSREQWAAFREALDLCAVWSWRRTNSHELDQRYWRVSIVYRGKKVECAGYGKLPGRTQNVYGGTVEFDNFSKAVQVLLGGKKFE